jgi:hypothetical protein
MSARSISDYLTQDHQRLDTLLDRVMKDAADIETYLKLRRGLLQHIRFEENILLPAVRKANNGQSIGLASKLRLDHGAIASLLSLSPTAMIIHALHTVLEAHNKLEEESGGAYSQCDELLGADAERLIQDFERMPPVPMAKNVDTAYAMEAAGRALERAGFIRSLLTV